MSATDDAESKAARAQAVASAGLVQDEEYKKLEGFQVDHRRIIFLDDEKSPQGGFGIVRRAWLYESAYLPAPLASRFYGQPQLVAVKQMKISKMDYTPRVKRAFTRELLVWATLPEHPGITKFLGFYAEFNGLEAWLLSPWEPNGSVDEFVKTHDLQVSQKLSLVYDTIDALAFLHQLDRPVCHGDIKSGNVLVTAKYKARLCDFGLAHLHGDGDFRRLATTTGNKSSIRWCSPELLDNEPRSPASDTYAWAWLVWEIMTGELPHKEAKTDFALMRKIIDSPIPQVDGESRFTDCPTLWDLMTECWNFDPLLRPTAKVCKATVRSLPRSTIDVHTSTRFQPGPSKTTSTTNHTEQRTASAIAVDEEYEKLKSFHIDHRRIVFVDGPDWREGCFGIVRRAQLYESAYLPARLASSRYGPPQFVAVKQIKIPSMSNVPRVKRAFTREMLVWSSLGEHPGITKFLGFYADFKRAEAWLLSPWEAYGNVREFLRAYNLEIPEKLSLVYDTIDALAFLHQLDPPVVHGSLKSADVLVTAEYKARLCDFGLAQIHKDSDFERLETSTGIQMTIRWSSPEILNGASREPPSDVYSWAWLVWEIMSGKVPYEETSVDFVVMRQIFEGVLPQVDGKSCLRDCLQVGELMTRCWNCDPEQRPTAGMCKTTVTHLPRCTPSPANADHSTPSAALLENLGDLESWKGNPESSFAYLDEALRLYQKEANAKGVASVLRKQAVATYRISDYVKLRAIATTALEHCRSLDDALGIAEASFYLGCSIQILGKSDEALPLLRQSLEIRRNYGDDVGVIQCLERIADVKRGEGQVQESLATLDRAVALASRSGDQVGLANVLHLVGAIHSDQSDFVKAAQCLSEAIKISEKVGWEGGLSTTSHAMGCLKMRLGECREAEELFQQSVLIARQIGDRWRLARGLEGLGGCYQKQSKRAEAVSALGESCLLWNELSQPASSKEVASSLVDLRSSQCDWNGALFWHDHIISVCRSQKDDWGVANHLERKGEILVKTQRYDEAALHFEAAIAYLRENGSSWGWEWRKLSTIPKTIMKWERQSPPLRDMKKLQRRLPQLVTAISSFRSPTVAESRDPVYSGH